MTRSPVALADPLPEGRRLVGAAHVVAEPAQRLIQHHADGTVVVGDQDASRRSCVLLFGRHGQQDAELGAPRLARQLDQAAMVGDDLGDERQAEALAARLARDERIEQPRDACASAMPGPLSWTLTTSGRCRRPPSGSASFRPSWIAGARG